MVTLPRRAGPGPLRAVPDAGQDWMLHRMDPPADPDAEPLPAHVVPMLARLGELPADRRRLGRRGQVGRRARARLHRGRAAAAREPQRPATSPPSTPSCARWPSVLGSRPALLDGEIVAFDPEGAPSFERLQGRMHVGSEAAVRRKQAEAPVTYLLFDVLHLDGRSLLDVPWEERRAALEALELEGPSWRTPGRAAAATARTSLAATTASRGSRGSWPSASARPTSRAGARARGSRSRTSPARSSSSAAGCPARAAAATRSARCSLGVHDEEGALRYAGRVGSGFTETELRRLARPARAARARRLAVRRRRQKPPEGRACGSSPGSSPRSASASGRSAGDDPPPRPTRACATTSIPAASCARGASRRPSPTPTGVDAARRPRRRPPRGAAAAGACASRTAS